MIIEHRMLDKQQNADSLSKRTELYEGLEQKQANQAEIKERFLFLYKDTNDALPLLRWLDKSQDIQRRNSPNYRWRNRQRFILYRRRKRYPWYSCYVQNLVQQELSSMKINCLLLLDKTLQFTPEVMQMLGRGQVTRNDPEWTAAMVSLTVSEKVQIKSSRRQHKENERRCKTVVQQLASSIPQSVIMRTSYETK